MPRLNLVFGGLAFAGFLAAQLLDYFEGLAFDKYWTGLLLVPLIIGSCLGYLVTAIPTAVAMAQRKVRRRWLLSMLSIPLCVVSLHALPIPSFTDGMRDSVRKKIAAERLLRYAEAARLLPLSPNTDETNDPRVSLMKREFPDIYELSAMAPRVDAGKGHVDIFWGSALVKHWGISIGSRPFLDAPVEYQKKVSCREVYHDIWVYHDFY